MCIFPHFSELKFQLLIYAASTVAQLLSLQTLLFCKSAQETTPVRMPFVTPLGYFPRGGTACTFELVALLFLLTLSRTLNLDQLKIRGGRTDFSLQPCLSNRYMTENANVAYLHVQIIPTGGGSIYTPFYIAQERK